MRRIIFIGSIGAGKTTLSQALLGEENDYEKTQQIYVRGDSIVDTPGEFLDQHHHKGALMNASAETEVVAFVQSAIDKKFMFPPCYAGSFAKTVVGVVTKVDEADEEQKQKAIKKLKVAGVPESNIFLVSGITNEGVDKLKEFLDDENSVKKQSRKW